MMRHFATGLLATTLLLTACVKDTKEIAQEVGLLPAGCGSAGARLQVNEGGNTFCADMQLMATGDGSSVIITGVDLGANSVVLQVDDLAVGEHPMTEAANGVMYMLTGVAYTVAAGAEGTLNILEHDAENRRLRATFNAPVFNELNGINRQLQGQVEVTYTVGG
jgi:hypothetical protein